MPTNNQTGPETKNAAGQTVESIQEKKQEESKPAMVEVPKEQFDQLMGLIPTVKQLEKDNEALKFAADRARLQIFQERQQEPGNKTVKLLTYVGEDRTRKVVLAWSKVRDDVYKAPNGAWVEDQVMEVVFEDDTKKELPLLSFYRNTADKIKAEVIQDLGD